MTVIPVLPVYSKNAALLRWRSEGGVAVGVLTDADMGALLWEAIIRF